MGRSRGALVVAGAHIALVLALLSMDAAPRVLAQATPLMVALLHNAEPMPRPAEAAPPALKAPPAQVPPAITPLPVPVPEMTTAPPVAPAANAIRVEASPPPAAADTRVAPLGVPAPAAPPQPAPPPSRRQLAASAVHYLVLPPVELPRASRRAGESGTVWLRVVVSVAGAPVQVSVQRSSGHARLDEQALWAMRQARFKPHTEDGRAVEVEVIAPIEYPAE